MRTFIRKSLDAFKQYRLGIFNIILNKLSPEKFSYKKLDLFYYDLQREISDAPPVNKSVTVKKVLDPEDEVFKQFRKKFPAEEFVTRLKKDKESAYIALKEGDIAAYAWVTEKEKDLRTINYKFPLDEDEIFLYACYVAREYRGKGLHSILLYERLKDYSRNSRFKTAYTAAISVNEGSKKGIKKMGFKYYNRVIYLRIFNWQKWWGLENLRRPEVKSPPHIRNGNNLEQENRDLEKVK